jgi:Permease MlaE
VTGLADVILGLLKSARFGLSAGSIACDKGTSVGDGPAGVGNAVNETVVLFVCRAVLHQPDTQRDGNQSHPMTHVIASSIRDCAASRPISPLAGAALHPDPVSLRDTTLYCRRGDPLPRWCG